MQVTDRQRRVIGAAAEAGRPFALWKAGGAAGFTAIAAASGTERRAVFGPGAPGFAVCAFRTDDGSLAEVIPADILADTGLHFADGAGGFVNAPVTEAQAGCATEMEGLAEGAPVQEGDQSPSTPDLGGDLLPPPAAEGEAAPEGGSDQPFLPPRAE